MGTMILGRPMEEIIDILAIYDETKTLKDEALQRLKIIRDYAICLNDEQITKNLNAGMICISELLLENEKLRREKEDLRMFCTGVARNITEMLK